MRTTQKTNLQVPGPLPEATTLRTRVRRRVLDWRWHGSGRTLVRCGLLGLIHTALYVLAMPLVSWWGLALVSAAPLVGAGMLLGGAGATERTRVPTRWVLVIMTLAVLPRELFQHWWTIPVTQLGFVPLALIQAFWSGLFVAVCARVVRPWAGRTGPTPQVAIVTSAAFAWVGIEYFRAVVFMGGYAWGLGVHPLIDWSNATPWAAVGGVWLVSLWTALGCAGLALLVLVWRRSQLRSARTLGPPAVAMTVGFGLLSIGSFIVPLPREQGEAWPVALIQTNVPQSNKVGWTLSDQVSEFVRFRALTMQSVRDGDAHGQRPAVIVWPETMMPGISLEPSVLAVLRDNKITLGGSEPLPGLGQATTIPADDFAVALLQTQRELGVPMLVGEEALDGFQAVVDAHGAVDFSHRARFNSVYKLSNGGVQLPRYDKIELTPFGEYIPVMSRFPTLERAIMAFAAAGMSFDLDAGTQVTRFDVNGVAAVTPICFEVTVPSLCRRLVYTQGKRQAQVMVNVTNDGWFTTSDLTREQHLQIARWRCVELGTPMVRAANTGRSALIDAHGRIIASLPAREEGILRGSVSLAGNDRRTPYATTGDWIGIFPMVATALALVATVVRRPREDAPQLS